MVEINPDIIPPFQWFLEESPAFTFEVTRSQRGMYGVSPDALLELMTRHGYRLVELELEDPASPCPRCEHNMWFVHLDVVSSVKGLPPPPSYDEYVAIFWSRRPMCLHMAAAYCSVGQVSKLLPDVSGHDASMLLLKPSHRAVAYRLLGSVAWGMEELCRNCTMHLGVSHVEACKREDA